LVQHLALFSPSTTTSNWTQNTVLAVAFLSCLFVPLTHRPGPSGQTLSPIRYNKLLHTRLSSMRPTQISLFLRRTSYFGIDDCRMRQFNGFNASCVIANGSRTMHPKEVYMTVRFFPARIPVLRVVASLPSSVLRVYAPKPLQDPQPTHPLNLH